jgi:hypothetical protein
MISIRLLVNKGLPVFQETFCGHQKVGHILQLEDGSTVDDFFISRRKFRFVLVAQNKKWVVTFEGSDIDLNETNRLEVIADRINRAIQSNQAMDIGYPELSVAIQHNAFQAVVIPD